MLLCCDGICECRFRTDPENYSWLVSASGFVDSPFAFCEPGCDLTRYDVASETLNWLATLESPTNPDVLVNVYGNENAVPAAFAGFVSADDPTEQTVAMFVYSSRFVGACIANPFGVAHRHKCRLEILPAVTGEQDCLDAAGDSVHLQLFRNADGSWSDCADETGCVNFGPDTIIEADEVRRVSAV